LPSNVIRWIANFLTGRTQAVSSDGRLSSWLPINQSIVQGSGIGPLVVHNFSADLELLSSVNCLCKYVDDTTLLVRENTEFCLEDEFKHVICWSIQNKLILNLAKIRR
jgi:hypothetical protein